MQDVCTRLSIVVLARVQVAGWMALTAEGAPRPSGMRGTRGPWAETAARPTCRCQVQAT